MKKITTDYVKGTKNYKQISDDTTPTVPEFVAKWFEEKKNNLESSIWSYIYCDMREDKEYDAFYDFMNSYDLNPIETLIMMQYGYYVEKEVKQLYVVEIPSDRGQYVFFLTKLNGKVAITRSLGYPVSTSRHKEGNSDYHLTEAEIRGVWDGYMELAEEVE
ncbi:DUF1642 domain-containing protein [Listeria seeligeri]|uniref:DUF1642 domain-containing protein n=1 Tax=Listeria seeligeri TaxID=1640 RepID=UPI00162932CE|nr:DUF1642 domain-containing protein [Listeria seeligeri]EGI1284618.1 DUF1642 domain-containing protein [Listeria monocytogenes]EKZ3712599.1 DUF1642 domain-containing protein [Listeria monocytogenes]EMD1349095.1 DUF1642 domain-containing protein [Listeria monocytogenes]MBC2086438.1 DUF1642 domain-containing protein [Listeria seeligeri]MBC2212684.1 DUF1642 domain-containing protein [Listeria seeligeri]